MIERNGQTLTVHVVAYFGWPEAHDNDGERGARAGLAIVESLSKLNDESTTPGLAVRVGVDSGPVQSVVVESPRSPWAIHQDLIPVVVRILSRRNPSHVLGFGPASADR